MMTTEIDLETVHRYIREKDCPGCGAQPGEECKDAGPDRVHLARCWSEKFEVSEMKS